MSDATRAAEQSTRLVRVMARLRGPDGCPWDREQTIDSLKPFVLEETYEVLEAIDAHDHPALCEELGDFVFEAVFLAQLESEAGHFTIADSLTSIADKLVRRHPQPAQRRPPGPARPRAMSSAASSTWEPSSRWCRTVMSPSSSLTVGPHEGSRTPSWRPTASR